MLPHGTPRQEPGPWKHAARTPNDMSMPGEQPSDTVNLPEGLLSTATAMEPGLGFYGRAQQWLGSSTR